jgi:hypothetical protein
MIMDIYHTFHPLASLSRKYTKLSFIQDMMPATVHFLDADLRIASVTMQSMDCGGFSSSWATGFRAALFMTMRQIIAIDIVELHLEQRQQW